MNSERAYLGEQPLWTTWHHHMVHCTYGFRKLHRAYEAGWIDANLRKYEHTEHCQKFLHMQGEELDGGRAFLSGDTTHLTYLNIVYPVCVKLGEGTTRSSWWDSQSPR
jgi:hypothetical protein